jgi:hypothetical protein
MSTFLYRCPNTGFQVQGYTPEQTSDDDGAKFIQNQVDSPAPEPNAK